MSEGHGPAPPPAPAPTTRTLYSMASCLLRDRDRAWHHYARAALRHDPLHWRAWTLFVRELLR
jgi:hypothetical protein